MNRPSLQGSVFWMAPEVVKQTAYTSKADIWSVGCLVVEMLTGTHPWAELSQMQAIFRVCFASECTADHLLAWILRATRNSQRYLCGRRRFPAAYIRNQSQCPSDCCSSTRTSLHRSRPLPFSRLSLSRTSQRDIERSRRISKPTNASLVGIRVRPDHETIACSVISDLYAYVACNHSTSMLLSDVDEVTLGGWNSSDHYIWRQ